MATNKTTMKENSSNISEKYSQSPLIIRTNDVNEDYKLTKDSLGMGINGKVYKCHNRITKQKCALKILQDSDASRREIMLHKRACDKCEYIVQIVDVYVNPIETTPCLLIIMERMEGGELFNRIQQRESKPYTERDAANFISMIVKAVAHLHSMDIAHRDLKPENLLFSTTGNDAVLKLTDFGFAKEGNNEPFPLITPCCTPYYVAPEVISQTKYDKACDIWSMGVIMYILLCGYPPFYSTDGFTLTPNMRSKIKAGDYEFNGDEWKNVSDDAKITIKRMLTVDPMQRITIDDVLSCSWLNEPTSERPIDISSILDEDNWNEIKTELASANEIQRRDDDDSQLDITGPETSQIVKKRTAKKDKKK